MVSESKAEAEMAVERLLDKHVRWLLQQPEVLYLWMQDRQTRRRVAAILAKQLTHIPVTTPDGMPNRAQRRAIFKALETDPDWWRRYTYGLSGAEEGPGPGVEAADEA
jgi:hypothetical protein